MLENLIRRDLINREIREGKRCIEAVNGNNIVGRIGTEVEGIDPCTGQGLAQPPATAKTNGNASVCTGGNGAGGREAVFDCTDLGNQKKCVRLRRQPEKAHGK